MTITDQLALAAVDVAVANGDPDALARIAAQLDAEDQNRRDRLTGPLGMANAAIWYAEQGIPVFPLVPGEKRPASRNGFKDATTDPEQVHTWWVDNPGYNIGFPTGHLFDVIDVDGPPGYRSLADLRDRDALPPVLARAITARGGTHLYVPVAGHGNKAGLLPGIDYRGAGGYVVAPPSVSTATGRRWTWTRPLQLEVTG